MTQTNNANQYRIPILMYHQIAAAPVKGSPYRRLYVSPQTFAKQMAFLRKLGYRGLSMAELFPYLQGMKSGKVFGITFDDGYLNNLSNALPVLQKNGFSSTCYVVGKLLGKTNLWDEEIGIRQVPLMDQKDLKQWVSGGQEVGAHTLSHARLPSLSKNQAREEIVDCKRLIENLIGVPVQHFCYPYGNFDDSHVDIVRDGGYFTATTTARGRCKQGGDMFRLPRITVARRTTRLGLWLRMAFGYRGNA